MKNASFVLARKLLEEGAPGKAVAMARFLDGTFEAMGDNAISFSGILIDAGYSLGNKNLINEAISRLEAGFTQIGGAGHGLPPYSQFT